MAGSYNTTRRFRRMMLLIPVLFLLLFVGVVRWELNILGDSDQIMSAYLNSWVGASEVTDLTIAFVSSPGGDFFIALLMMIVGWQIVARRQPANLATFVALLLYLGIVLGVTYETVDLMDDYIMRPGPSHVLVNYQNPWEQVGASERPPRSVSFPSQRGAICAMVFFLFLFRYGSRSLSLLAITLGYGLILCIAGENWPSDYVGGIIYGWIVSVMVYVVGFYRAPHYLERVFNVGWRRFVVGGDGSLASMVRRRKKRHVPGAGDVEDLRLGTYGLPADIVTILSDKYGITEPQAIDKPHKGKLYPILADGRKVAVKISRSKHKECARLDFALATAMELRESGGIDMPEILATTRGELTTSYHGNALYLMEWIEGTPVDIQSTEGAKRLMDLMARLHSHPVTPPDRRAGIEPEHHVAAVAESFGRSLEMSEEALASPWRAIVPSHAEFEDLNIFVEHGQRAIGLAKQAGVLALRDKSPMRWSIVHKDSHEMNYLVTGDDRIVMLDFDLIRIDLGISDLVKPLRKLMKGTHWSVEAFTEAMDAYVAVRPLERFELVLLMAHLLYPFALTKMRGKMKKGRKVGRGEFRMMLMKERLQLTIEEGTRSEFVRGVSEHYDLRMDAGTVGSVDVPRVE